MPAGTIPSVPAVTDALANKASSVFKGKIKFNEEDAGKCLFQLKAIVKLMIKEFYEPGLPVVS